MNQLVDSAAAGPGAAAESLPVGEEETVTASLAEMIVEFDPSPYLSGPVREVWDVLHTYPALLAFVLIAMGARARSPISTTKLHTI